MNDVKSLFIGTFAVTISILYILIELTDFYWLKDFTSIVIFLFCIFVFPLLTKNIKLILTIFIAFAIFLCFTIEQPVTLFLKGIRSNLPLISLFLLSSMLSTIVRKVNYINALKVFLKKFRNNPFFYYFNTFILTHLFGVILNISTVQINLYLSKAYNVSSVKLITRILNRGFTTTLYWSPYFSATALVLTNLSVNWGDIVLLSLGYIFLTIMISFLTDFHELQKENNRLKIAIETLLDKEQQSKATINHNLLQLFSAIILICVLTIIVDRYILHNMVLTICILSIIYPFFWSYFTNDLPRYKGEMINYFHQVLPNFKQEISLFTMAGLISTLFAASPLRFYLIDALVFISNESVYIVSWTICLSIILSAIIGLHPIFLVTLLVTSIDPETLQIKAQFFAVMLLVSWGISNNVSPITAVNGILGRHYDIPLKTVSLGWNWKLSFILILILPIYLFIFT